MKINQICGRLLIVADEVAHEDIENVIVHGHDFFEARHGVDLTAIPINGQRFLA